MLAKRLVLIFEAETWTTSILVLFANSEQFFHFRFSAANFIFFHSRNREVKNMVGVNVVCLVWKMAGLTVVKTKTKMKPASDSQRRIRRIRRIQIESGY